MSQEFLTAHFAHDRTEEIDSPDQFSDLLRRSNLMVAGQDGSSTDITGVVFPPGVRTRPHIHSVDQILHVLTGRGAVATKGRLQLLYPGDWILIPAGTWHWHGATPDDSFTQMALKHGGETDWYPEIGDWDEYLDVGA